MTQLMKEAYRLLEDIPEDKMIYVVEILKSLHNFADSGTAVKRKSDTDEAMEALRNLKKYKGILPKNFDYKKELQESREERYGNID